MGDEYAIRKAMLEKYKKKQNVGVDQNVDEQNDNDDRDEEMNNQMNADCKDTSMYKYQQTL